METLQRNSPRTDLACVTRYKSGTFRSTIPLLSVQGRTSSMPCWQLPMSGCRMMPFQVEWPHIADHFSGKVPDKTFCPPPPKTFRGLGIFLRKRRLMSNIRVGRNLVNGFLLLPLFPRAAMCQTCQSALSFGGTFQQAFGTTEGSGIPSVFFFGSLPMNQSFSRFSRETTTGWFFRPRSYPKLQPTCRAFLLNLHAEVSETKPFLTCPSWFSRESISPGHVFSHFFYGRLGKWVGVKGLAGWGSLEFQECPDAKNHPTGGFISGTCRFIPT